MMHDADIAKAKAALAKLIAAGRVTVAPPATKPARKTSRTHACRRLTERPRDEEMYAWRTTRGLSMTDAAEAVGVSRPRWVHAEMRNTARTFPLPA
jgi:hypothetical protein